MTGLHVDRERDREGQIQGKGIENNDGREGIRLKKQTIEDTGEPEGRPLSRKMLLPSLLSLPSTLCNIEGEINALKAKYLIIQVSNPRISFLPRFLEEIASIKTLLCIDRT